MNGGFRLWRVRAVFPVLLAGLVVTGIVGVGVPAMAAQPTDKDGARSVKHLVIAVGQREPGYFGLVTRIAAAFNERDDKGLSDQDSVISIMPVTNTEQALKAADAGIADVALAPAMQLDKTLGKRAKGFWQRAVAVETLSVISVRNRLVRDPRKLRGLRVEVAGEHAEEIIALLNDALTPYHISLPGGSYISGGGGGVIDPYIRLCRGEYDVRVDMIIHPFVPLENSLPCSVRMLSFGQNDGINHPRGVLRHKLPPRTYRWQNQSVYSLGSAVALVSRLPADDRRLVDLGGFLDQMAGNGDDILSGFDAALWLGRDPAPIAGEVVSPETASPAVLDGTKADQSAGPAE